MSWQSGPLLTQTNALQGIGQLRAAAAADHIGVAAWETSSGAESEIRVVGIGPTGGASPPVPGKSVVVGVVSGQVFVTSRGGKRTRLTGAANIPVGAQVDTSKGRVRLTSAATGTGTTTQTADFYQGAFKVKQSAAQGQPRRRADHGHHPRRRDVSVACASARGAGAAAVSKKKGAHAVLGQAVGQRQGQVPHERASTARRRCAARSG